MSSGWITLAAPAPITRARHTAAMVTIKPKRRRVAAKITKAVPTARLRTPPLDPVRTMAARSTAAIAARSHHRRGTALDHKTKSDIAKKPDAILGSPNWPSALTPLLSSIPERARTPMNTPITRRAAQNADAYTQAARSTRSASAVRASDVTNGSDRAWPHGQQPTAEDDRGRSQLRPADGGDELGGHDRPECEDDNDPDHVVGQALDRQPPARPA